MATDDKRRSGINVKNKKWEKQKPHLKLVPPQAKTRRFSEPKK